MGAGTTADTGRGTGTPGGGTKKIVAFLEQGQAVSVLLSSGAPRSGSSEQGRLSMKKIATAAVVALGVMSLAACKQSPQEQAADNIEANAENTADVIEANTENASDMVEANGQNAADEVRAAGENAADQVRNGADADGNSAN